MIPIQKQKEPDDFEQKVRLKGLCLSQSNQLKPYWQDCIEDLYAIYNGVCAYYAILIDDITGLATVDHFKPKSKYPELAYEWDNYRLACFKANSYKNDFEDVLDPFQLKNELFFIHFGTGEIMINEEKENPLKSKAEQTIKRLRLNDHKLKHRRQKDFQRYKQNEITFSELKYVNPFVYSEIIRQNLENERDLK